MLGSIVVVIPFGLCNAQIQDLVVDLLHRLQVLVVHLQLLLESLLIPEGVLGSLVLNISKSSRACGLSLISVRSDLVLSIEAVLALVFLKLDGFELADLKHHSAIVY